MLVAYILASQYSLVLFHLFIYLFIYLFILIIFFYFSYSC